MSHTKRKMSTGRKILIGLLVFVIIAGAAFHIFITRYLPPIVKKRLAEIIVKGSDSLYTFEVGKFDLSLWGGSVNFTDLRIRVDSNQYRILKEAKRLPPMSSELVLQKGSINGISLSELIFSKRIKVREIVFDSANLTLARHFRNSEEKIEEGQPLWKLIQPRIRSIEVRNIYCADLKINYKNVDSATAFRWQFDKSNLLLTDIRIDSASSMDSTRMLFAKNLSFNAKNIKLKTTDGLYQLNAGDVAYSSGTRSMDIKQFDFMPAVSDQQFIKHFGYQHEIYKLKVPVIRMKNFVLARWVTDNKFQSDTIELSSPSIAISMDRNAKPNVKSKKGGYPQQMLQKLPFIVDIRRLTAMDANVTYTEISNITNRAGKVSFTSLSGAIDNISNDPASLQRSDMCIADIRGKVMGAGNLNTVFRFNLKDPDGAFSVKATITQLDAAQLRPVFTAMTAVEMQSFSMKRLDYSMNGNENSGTGALSMKYDNMDILLNKVQPDKTLDKKGFLSFLANRLVIYKENPMNGEERKASAIVVERDATRSFFNLVWKTMFAAAGEIVLRPMAQKRMEKKQIRQERREERRNGKK